MNQHPRILSATDRLLTALVVRWSLGSCILFRRRSVVVPSGVCLRSLYAILDDDRAALARAPDALSSRAR